MLTLAKIIEASVSRAKEWHKGGISDWSPLEWAGAMAGEMGEVCNIAKKLKRLTDIIPNIANVTSKKIPDVETATKEICKELADTILYAVLVAASVDGDLETAIIEVFNTKSIEYGFPERL